MVGGFARPLAVVPCQGGMQAELRRRRLLLAQGSTPEIGFGVVLQWQGQQRIEAKPEPGSGAFPQNDLRRLRSL
jgi:hypothetical protein